MPITIEEPAATPSTATARTARVAVVRTRPETVLEDYARVMELARYRDTISRDRDTLLKLNLSWTKYFPACSSQPWQVDGVIGRMLADGYDRRRLIPIENKTVVTASTLIGYAVYATSAETAQRLGTARLGLTIPFVLYGIFRYLYLVHQKRAGGSPAALLLTDRPLLACVAAWAVAVTVLLYSPAGRN